MTPTLSTIVPPTSSAACLQRDGRMVSRELIEPGLPRSIPYRIFLPPCFVEHPSWRFPVLFLLHGLAATDSQWDDLGADEAAQRLIASSRVSPFLIVMPWERRGLDWGDALWNHLVPYVESVYHASSDPSQRAIGGLSRGAGWAFRIGFEHAGAFGSIGLHSPAILVPDEFLLANWTRDLPDESLPRLWVDIGERDSLKRAALELTATLDELQLPYTWHLYPGDHVSQYWESHIEEYLTWYAENWRDPAGGGP
jgi:enterochelin esterase-like enzyme